MGSPIITIPIAGPAAGTIIPVTSPLRITINRNGSITYGGNDLDVNSIVIKINGITACLGTTFQAGWNVGSTATIESGSGKKIRIHYYLNHSAAFSYSSTITAQITAKDSTNPTMNYTVPNPYVITWQTEAPADTLPPGVSNQSPAVGAVGVTQPVTISFKVKDAPAPGGVGVKLSTLAINIKQGTDAYESVFTSSAFTSNYSAGSSYVESITNAGREYDFTIKRTTNFTQSLITVQVIAADENGNTQTTAYSFTLDTDSIESDFTGYIGGDKDTADIIVYNPKEKLLPESARQPWTKWGSVVPTFGSSFEYLEIDDNDPLHFVHYINTLKNKILYTSNFEFSVDIEINEYILSTVSTIQFQLCDGNKVMNFAIGNKVEIANNSNTPYFTSDILVEQDKKFNLRIRKVQEKYIEIYIDDILKKTFQYYYCTNSTDHQKYFKFGSFSLAGQNKFKIYHLAYAINIPLPTSIECSRAINYIKSWITQNDLLINLFRDFCLGMKSVKSDIETLDDIKKSDKVITQEIYMLGDTSPLTDKDYPWLVCQGSGGTAQNKFSEWDIDDNSTTKRYYNYQYAPTGLDKYHDIEVDFYLTIVDYQTDINGFLGVFFQIYDGTRVIILGLQEINDDRKIGFTDGAGNWVSDTIHIDFEQKNRIRILKSHDHLVYASLNGVIFTCTDYTDFPTLGAMAIPLYAPPPPTVGDTEYYSIYDLTTWLYTYFYTFEDDTYHP